MKTLLTIDWDFFVAADPELDIGMADSAFFVFTAWEFRTHLLGQITTNDCEKDFWNWVKIWAKLRNDSKFFVSESHVHAYDIANKTGIEQVISFDLHHDCWPTKEKTVSCETWLQIWLAQNTKNKAIWVRPRQRNDYGCVLPKCKSQLTEKVYNSNKRLVVDQEIVAVHVCRSGGWTPPWLDYAFVKFVEKIEKDLRAPDICIADVHGVDPTTPRWTLHQLVEAYKQKEMVNYYLTED